MKELRVKIIEEEGLHGRPAKRLCYFGKKAFERHGCVSHLVTKEGKSVELNKDRILAILFNAVHKNDEIMITVEGGDEDAGLKLWEDFFPEFDMGVIIRDKGEQ